MYVCVLYCLFIVLFFVCVCAPTNVVAAARIYTAQKRERKEERKRGEKREESACKSLGARRADVHALMARSRPDKAGGEARRLTEERATIALSVFLYLLRFFFSCSFN